MLSGLQHFRFCPRQCALIHIEQLWIENFFTASGRVQHEKVHGGISESRKNLRTERSLRIASSILGVTGQTDVVEFYSDGKVVPVEYKHGRPKDNTSDEVQLCAQVICIEEMLNCKIDEGALYYFKTKKRKSILITNELRSETIELAENLHTFIKKGITPNAEYTKKCESCSFIDFCLPESVGRRKSVDIYIQRRIKQEVLSDEGI